MRIHDRTTGTLREVEIRPRMGVYVCGITPYDSEHIGHAFTYVQFDVLVRHLRRRGADVVHVQNVTDVDDDILRVARERGEDFRELAERETAAFEKAMAALNVTPPTHSPRASQYVGPIIEEVRALLKSSHAYEREGTVYFSVSSDAGYGRLSGLDREQMLELADERGGHPEDPNKDDPLDFVLWQRSVPGEPEWDSPWGPGRPGWHIECSTMSRRLLGQPVDIHGGGNDLIFPHHESELAQAEGVPGERPFVRHWMHTGMVFQGPEKMSKSLGNLTFVRDLLERYEPVVIREFLLRHHYRQDWHFREKDLAAYVANRITADQDSLSGPGPGPDELYEALDEDLDTPRAMNVLDRAAASGEPGALEALPEMRAALGLDI